MAIIGKIREKSTLVLIIIGGAIMAFVLSDLFSSSAGGQQRPMNLAEVDNTVINPQEFELKVQKAYENFQKQNPETELDERTKSTIRDQVWTEMLSDILLGREMQELGVEVTTKELFDMVQGKNPHPQVKQAFANPETGQYDPSAVVNFLQNLDRDPEVKQQWIDFERALKRNQRITKYYTLVKKGLYYPSALAKEVNRDNKTSISFQYAYLPYTSIPDSTVELSEGEIEDYYEANKSDYKQEQSIKLLYAFFPVEPSEMDMAKAKEWANEIYNKFQKAENDSIFVNANSDNRYDPTFYSLDNLPNYIDTSLLSKEIGIVSEPKLEGNRYYISKFKALKMAPDSVKASHLLINTQEQEEEVAEALTDSLITLLENGEATIEDLAREFSDDQGTAELGGDLGWFTEGRMVKPFNEVAFTAELGEFNKIKTQFGFHIIEVKEKTALRQKYQTATVIREVLPSNETFADVFNNANSFSINANDVTTFNEEVTAKNIRKRTAVINENTNSIQGLGASRDLVRWARDADENQVSEAYDVDDGFVVAVVESVNKKGFAPLDKVRNRVEFLARQDKKAELLKEKMNGFSSLEELAGKLAISVERAENVTFSSPSIENVGLEPKLVGKAISLEKDQMSVPIQGDNGVFVIKVNNKTVPEEVNIAQSRNLVRQDWNGRIENGLLFDALKEKADLTDNRSKFY